MAHVDSSGGSVDPADPGVPDTNKTLLAIAGVCLAIPVVALVWVSTYARETPRLGGVPFFFWYQFLWVFLCAGLTYTAHRLVLAARRGGRRTPDRAGRHAGPREEDAR